MSDREYVVGAFYWLRVKTKTEPAGFWTVGVWNGAWRVLLNGPLSRIDEIGPCLGKEPPGERKSQRQIRQERREARADRNRQLAVAALAGEPYAAIGKRFGVKPKQAREVANWELRHRRDCVNGVWVCRRCGTTDEPHKGWCPAIKLADLMQPAPRS
jgi:hypothetical protein